jgi:hypothetical protein
MRRQQLTETQIAALYDPPTEPHELVRHYMLTGTDLAMIRRSAIFQTSAASSAMDRASRPPIT